MLLVVSKYECLRCAHISMLLQNCGEDKYREVAGSVLVVHKTIWEA